MSESNEGNDKWMEIFHSKPSMSKCYFLEKLPSGEFTKPSPENMLLDASHVRPAFRVMRRKATRVEFALTNGTDRNWEDNSGANYVIDAVPGRYVVEHGIRRVGEADVQECRQAVLRHADRYIHIRFRADLWDKCFANFQVNGCDWTQTPGEEMTLMTRPGMEGRNFELVIEAQRIAVAFNDGGDVWDGNKGDNYLVGLPGMYDISSDRGVQYLSPTEKDMLQNPVSSVSQASVANVSLPAKPPMAHSVPQPYSQITQ